MAATRRDVEDVYNSLATVGLPPSVSLEQFTRLYRAKLADALSFMSQSMLGRTPVSQGRKRISEMPDTQHSRKVSKAESRLTSSKRTLGICRPELGDYIRVCERQQDEIDLLKVKLQGKRRVAALLKALEEKEMNRIRRLQEITALAKKLKESISARKPNEKTITPRPQITIPRIRLSATRDALAILEAHHLKLLKTVSSVSSPEIVDYPIRLKGALQKHMASRDAHVQTTVTQIIEWARKAAKRKASLSLRSVDSKTDLDAMTARVTEDENLLQDASDEVNSSLAASLALGRSIEALRFNSTLFQSEPDLESPSSTSHVDMMRCRVDSHPHPTGDEDTVIFRRAVCDVLGASRHTTVAAILAIVQTLLSSRRRTNKESRLTEQMAKELFNGYSQDELSDVYLLRTEDHARETLSRKLTKASAAMGIIDDIRRLEEEWNFINRKR